MCSDGAEGDYAALRTHVESFPDLKIVVVSSPYVDIDNDYYFPGRRNLILRNSLKFADISVILG